MRSWMEYTADEAYAVVRKGLHNVEVLAVFTIKRKADEYLQDEIALSANDADFTMSVVPTWIFTKD